MKPVSYTHLDVYKRQTRSCCEKLFKKEEKEEIWCRLHSVNAIRLTHGQFYTLVGLLKNEEDEFFKRLKLK